MTQTDDLVKRPASKYTELLRQLEGSAREYYITNAIAAIRELEDKLQKANLSIVAHSSNAIEDYDTGWNAAIEEAAKIWIDEAAYDEFTAEDIALNILNLKRT